MKNGLELNVLSVLKWKRYEEPKYASSSNTTLMLDAIARKRRKTNMRESVNLKFLFNGREVLEIPNITARVTATNQLSAALEHDIKIFVPEETEVKVVASTRFFENCVITEFFEPGGEISLSKQEIKFTLQTDTLIL